MAEIKPIIKQVPFVKSEDFLTSTNRLVSCMIILTFFSMYLLQKDQMFKDKADSLIEINYRRPKHFTIDPIIEIDKKNIKKDVIIKGKTIQISRRKLFYHRLI